MTLNGTEVIRNAASHDRYSIRHTSFRSRELNITDKREINTSFLPERKGKFSLRASGPGALSTAGCCVDGRASTHR